MQKIDHLSKYALLSTYSEPIKSHGFADTWLIFDLDPSLLHFARILLFFVKKSGVHPFYTSLQLHDLVIH